MMDHIAVNLWYCVTTSADVNSISSTVQSVSSKTHLAQHLAQPRLTTKVRLVYIIKLRAISFLILHLTFLSLATHLRLFRPGDLSLSWN